MFSFIYELVYLFTKVILILKMVYRGWVKKLPSSLTAAHSALFCHHQTNNKNNGCSGTTHHVIKSPLPIGLPLPPSPFLYCSIKQGAAKKLWELVVIWLFHCDLPLTIFMNSMLSSTQNLLRDIIAQIDFWPATYTTPLGCSFQQGTSKKRW